MSSRACDMIRAKMDKECPGRTRAQKEKWIKDFFNKYNCLGKGVDRYQFRMALAKLGMNASDADSVFDIWDESRTGFLSVDLITTHFCGKVEVLPDFGLGHGTRMIDTRTIKRYDEDGGLPADIANQKTIDAMWDQIANKCHEKNFKTVGQVIRLMDPNDSGEMTREKAQVFFQRFLCLPSNKADMWFDMLDVDGRGTLDLQNFADHLGPYFNAQKSFGLGAYTSGRAWVKKVPPCTEQKRQNEIAKYFEIIGKRCQDKGIMKLQEVMRTMDPDDSGSLERPELRNWFARFLNMPAADADIFFDLLDVTGAESIESTQIRKHLAPYFQNLFAPERQSVVNWVDVPAVTADQKRRQQTQKSLAEIVSRVYERGMEDKLTLKKKLDKDDSGTLDKMEMRQFFKNYLGYHKADQADQFFALLDESGSGQISVDSIVRAFTKGNKAFTKGSTQSWDEDSDETSEDVDSQRNNSVASVESAQGKRSSANARQETLRSPEKVELSSLVLKEFRKILVGRHGPVGFNKFANALRAKTPSKTQRLDMKDLELCLQDLGLIMDPIEIGMLVQSAGKVTEDIVGAETFIAALRGTISVRRQQLIDRVFQQLDQRRVGHISRDDIKSRFVARFYPDVSFGSIRETSAFSHFLSLFDNEDIAKVDFSEYWSNIAACIESDKQFEQVLLGMFDIRA